MDECDFCTEQATEFCPQDEHGQVCDDHLDELGDCDCV